MPLPDLGTPNKFPRTTAQASARAQIAYAWGTGGLVGLGVYAWRKFSSSRASDPTSAHLRKLSPATAQRAAHFVNAVRQRKIPLIITSSLRSSSEQRSLVAAGRSFNEDSAHLYGRAFDVDVAGVSRADLPAGFWQWLGPIGEAYGFKWGGRWRRPFDPGHFEL